MAASPQAAAAIPVLRLRDVGSLALARLFAPFGLQLVVLADEAPIPGSYWGESEAGLVGARLLVRADTPVHSLLHEGCHFICMDRERRAALDRDAGGDDLEEAAVCYLQVLLAAQLPEVGGAHLMRDMDAWGYSFRLGSAQAWFSSDAADARDWLLRTGLIDATGAPTGRNRG
jgi:hypothetical protein